MSFPAYTPLPLSIFLALWLASSPLQLSQLLAGICRLLAVDPVDDAWEALGTELQIDMEVKVRVHKVSLPAMHVFM